MTEYQQVNRESTVWLNCEGGSPYCYWKAGSSIPLQFNYVFHLFSLIFSFFNHVLAKFIYLWSRQILVLNGCNSYLMLKSKLLFNKMISFILNVFCEVGVHEMII